MKKHSFFKYTALVFLFFLATEILIISNKTLTAQQGSYKVSAKERSLIQRFLDKSDTKYLALAKYGFSAGHTDMADLYFDTYNTSKDISSSDVFVLGNSRAQLGITERLFDYAKGKDFKPYHLGNGCGERIDFGLRIIDKYNAKPKVLLINADQKFTDSLTWCTGFIFERSNDVYQTYLISREKNRLLASLLVNRISSLEYLYKSMSLDVSRPTKTHNFFDPISDVMFKLMHPDRKWFPIEFRDIRDGRWQRVVEDTIPTEIRNHNIKLSPVNSCSLSSEETVSIIGGFSQLKRKFPDVKLVFVYVPTHEYCMERLKLINQVFKEYLSSSSAYFFDSPEDIAYYAYDRSHLSIESARLYTERLVQWLEDEKVLIK